jgi:hypothetical protein
MVKSLFDLVGSEQGHAMVPRRGTFALLPLLVPFDGQTSTIDKVKSKACFTLVHFLLWLTWRLQSP